MEKGWLHLDNRLVHGQILYTWCPYYQVNEICVISERLLSNPFQQTLLSMSMPPAIQLAIKTLQEAVDDYGQSTSEQVYLFDAPELLRQFWMTLDDSARSPEPILHISGTLQNQFRSSKTLFQTPLEDLEQFKYVFEPERLF